MILWFEKERARLDAGSGTGAADLKIGTRPQIT